MEKILLKSSTRYLLVFSPLANVQPCMAEFHQSNAVLNTSAKVFRISTVRYNWPMSAHTSQEAFNIAHCTDSEDLPTSVTDQPRNYFGKLFFEFKVPYAQRYLVLGLIGLGLPLLLRLGSVGLALWLVPGIALNKYCCEYGILNSMFATIFVPLLPTVGGRAISGKSSESVQCAITGPCLRMRHRPAAQHTVPIWKICAITYSGCTAGH